MMALLKISKGKNISKWPTLYSCYILVKNVAVLCPCSKKKKSEAKLRSFRLNPNIDCVMWLLVFTLMQIYNGGSKLSKERCKMHNVRRKGPLGSINPELKQIKIV